MNWRALGKAMLALTIPLTLGFLINCGGLTAKITLTAIGIAAGIGTILCLYLFFDDMEKDNAKNKTN